MFKGTRWINVDEPQRPVTRLSHTKCPPRYNVTRPRPFGSSCLCIAPRRVLDGRRRKPNTTTTTTSTMSNEKLIMAESTATTGSVPTTLTSQQQQHHQSSDYDRLRDLRLQCSNMMNELKTLSKEHRETLSRLENVTRDLEFHKQHSNNTQKKFDDLQDKYDQVLYDCNKLRQDYENIVLLREQEMCGQFKCSVCYSSELEAASLPPPSVASSSSNTATSSTAVELEIKYQRLQKEKLDLIEQNNKLGSSLKSALQSFEKTHIERNHEFKLLKGQNEKMGVDLQECRKRMLEMSQVIKSAKDEKSKARNELDLVMSERETVHQEIQELQENLRQTQNKARELNEDKEKAFLDKEGFQRDIQSVLADRDQARRENRTLQERVRIADKKREELSRECEIKGQDIEMLRQEMNAAKKERSEAIVHRDKILKECFDVRRSFEELGCDSEVAERLNKELSKLSGDLANAWKQTDVALSRRNWAFNERDKILKELESLKEKYSYLEKERIHQDEKLRKVMVESKSFKELHRENVQLRTTLLNKGSAMPSQDSAIDTESPAYQICQIDLEKNTNENEFGFKISGGVSSANDNTANNTTSTTTTTTASNNSSSNSEVRKNDAYIIISDVTPGSLADNNNLKVNDCVLFVNDVDMTNTGYQKAYDAIFNSTDHIRMRILRYSKIGLKSPLQRLEIKGGDEKNIGLSIDSGLYIKKIEPGSAAAEEETISIGDKILTINGFSSENISYDDAKEMLKRSVLSLTVLKPNASTTSSHRSLVVQHDRATDHTESDSMASADGFRGYSTAIPPQTVTPLLTHMRSPSAPMHLGSPEFAFFQHGGGVGGYSHGKSTSIINKLSDDEIKKVLANLTDEQKRREQLEMIDEMKPHRSPSFITAVNSINSSVGSRDRISSPHLSMTPSDPLALDFARTIGQASSATASNTSLSSMHQKRVVKVRRPYEHHTWTGPPPLKASSKQGSWRSVSGGPFSNSSHGSLNSDFSETHTLPVNVEERPQTSPIDEHPPSAFFPSSRRSGRSSVSSRPENGSLTPSRKGSKRSADSKTPTSNEERTRLITIERGQQPLGITIIEGEKGGIFVSSVTEGSHAEKCGLKYGDQLREFNGINLRSADKRQAETILRSAKEDTVTVKVLYNPDKIAKENSISTQSTPCTARKSVVSSPAVKRGQGRAVAATTGAGSYSIPGTPVSMHLRLSSNTSSSSGHSKLFYTENKITPIPENDDVGEPRLIHINRVPSSTQLGLGIIGGNDTGIFISDIQKGSLASQSGLRCGDQILKYNDKNMRRSTLEEATLELGKHTELSDLQVQYHPPGYRKAKTHSNDSFYVRAQFDRLPHGKGELGFKKGDILHVTETLYKGQLGVWNASIIMETEVKTPNLKMTIGKIPSKQKAEQELLLRRSSSYGDDKSKNRKSIFRRSKKGSSHYAINHSRESSDSKADVESTVSGGTSFVFVADDFSTYQYVKRFESKYPRPVVIVGAMNEPICDKLVIDFTKNFTRCFEVVHMEQDKIEENIENGSYLDYKVRGDRYEVIASQAVKDFPYKQPKHCLLDVNMEAIERIINNQLSPIVIYVKYKSAKIIRDMKDDHYIKEKLSSKDAKDMQDVYNKMEKDYKHLFNVTLNCTNLTQICKDINDAVIEQQNKVLWVIDES